MRRKEQLRGGKNESCTEALLRFVFEQLLHGEPVNVIVRDKRGAERLERRLREFLPEQLRLGVKVVKAESAGR